MFNEPPYAERHVRWCERTGNQLMITFLLDFVIILFSKAMDQNLAMVYEINGIMAKEYLERIFFY
jgi:hypothetical protein